MTKQNITNKKQAISDIMVLCKEAALKTRIWTLKVLFLFCVGMHS